MSLPNNKENEDQHMIHRKNLIEFETPPKIIASAAVGGKKEGEGPLGDYFDTISGDSRFGTDSWEKGEAKMQEETIRIALRKAKLPPEQIDLLICGDLINQCIASAYSARNLSIPYAGVYNACASMAESMVFGAVLAGLGVMDHVVCAASSHFCTAERQYRYPLEYGGQRSPSAQWTATAAGAAVISGKSDAVSPVSVKRIFFGRVIDYGITDLTNMGAAMAPAAADTLMRYFEQTKTSAQDYDAIVTGDLGKIGSVLLRDLLQKENITLLDRQLDCGMLLFGDWQDVHAGGSGCGCCASVLCGYLLERLAKKEWRNILFLATGALMSPMSVQQGETIPCISHLLHLTSLGTGE